MDMVAIGRVVLTSREHIIGLEPMGKGLVGTLLRYPYGEKRSQQFRPPVRQAAARSPLSTPRATILESSSDSGLLQTARFIPRRPHPGVSLFVCGQDHRHGLGMDRLDDGVRCRGQEPINQMRALNGVSTWCPCRPFSSVQMSANAKNGRLEFDRCEPFVPLCREVLDLLEFQDCWFAFSDDCRCTPTLEAGPQASTRTPNAQSLDNPTWLKAG